MTTQFFQPGDCTDIIYRNYRDGLKEQHTAGRNFTEYLWSRYQGLEDPHFLSDAKSHFIERFWEMYLAVTLLEHGFKLSRGNGTGPEFWFLSGDRKIWVEAVAPGPGEGPDRVSEDPHADPSEKKILLRFTAAIAEKHQRYLAALVTKKNRQER